LEAKLEFYLKIVFMQQVACKLGRLGSHFSHRLGHRNNYWKNNSSLNKSINKRIE